MSRVNKFVVMLGLVAGLGLVSSACFVSAEPAGPVVATNYYTPLYYNGYLVYYTATGLPYYYYGGRMVYIPRTYHGYARYYNHWRVHRVHYSRWYRSRGHRYRTYNRRRYRRSRRRNRRVRRKNRRRTRRKARRKRRGRF